MTTPSQHTPVLLHEALDALNVRPDGTYADCTFGRGGHSRALLEQLGSGGRLVALDRDLAAVTAARDIVDERFTIVHAAFSDLRRALAGIGVHAVDGVLLDLGMAVAETDGWRSAWAAFEAARGEAGDDRALRASIEQNLGYTWLFRGHLVVNVNHLSLATG